LVLTAFASAQTFQAASASALQDLKSAEAELSDLRSNIADERIPLAKELTALESELLTLRNEARRATGNSENRTVDLNALKVNIEARAKSIDYMSSLLSDYARQFGERIHSAEVQLYNEQILAVNNVANNVNLSTSEKFEVQLSLLSTGIDRLDSVLGGSAFEGSAFIAETGVKTEGKFSLLGPIAYFSAADGLSTGRAVRNLNSEFPTIKKIKDSDADAINTLNSTSSGVVPIDATLGDATRMEEVEETIIEHIKKGGQVIYVILALGAAALLISIFKWFEINSVKRPQTGDLQNILDALNNGDEQKALSIASSVPGPFGELLISGVKHYDQEKELLEEILYERLLATQPKLERFLAFIALTAGAAPLLGLLGTVTGMIKTFKLITVFGTGDAKSLSSGISEALITTEYGLLVAIPALLLQALLSRKAKATLGEMEQTSVAFVNGLTSKKK
ncbi:MAG: MotA/TolQ/ExbB proton channel family protein, partial [Opitutaceae bacterium]|nr:MotA/TolQ/ExbB proton channel family protein [Opitutaceae bacterium]